VQSLKGGNLPCKYTMSSIFQAPSADPAVYGETFFDKYMHRLIMEGIGHNLPQEVLRAFALAIVEVDGY
jgi:hypothetical protein